MNAQRTVSYGEAYSGWARGDSALIGSIWERRDPANDGYDRVRLVGVAAGNEVVDVVIQPVEHGEAVSLDPEQLAAEWTRVRQDGTSERIANVEARLAALAGEPV